MSSTQEQVANQIINTTQPTPLRGLKVRSSKPIETIRTVRKGEGPNGADLYMIVNEEDYDKEKHGVKVDKLPKRGKKASAEEESEEESEEEEEEEEEEESEEEEEEEEEEE